MKLVTTSGTARNTFAEDVSGKQELLKHFITEQIVIGGEKARTI